ncbi:pyridoxine 5'-phosphate oxidase C-terminal domain-containing protein, partial [Acinetobacter baumannii]
PEFWGGYRLQPDYYEFWQGRPNRLHDRLSYEKIDGQWTLYRLMP